MNDGGEPSRLRYYGQFVEGVPVTVSGLAPWRARPGEIFSVEDSAGRVMRCRAVGRGGTLSLLPFADLPGPVESPSRLTVCQALPARERFELVLQKLTEVGVQRIVPMTTRHSTTLEERDSGQRKSHRWPDVILRAARQCRRGMLPELLPVIDWPEVLALPSPGLRLLLDTGPGALPLTSLPRDIPAEVTVLVGPEGGFAVEEVSAAVVAGYTPVRIGPRLLRTETAAIVAAAIMQYSFGDLGY